MTTPLCDKEVRVRKRHKCCWCNEWIEVGHMARYRAYKWFGDFKSDYMHTECEEASGEVAAEEGECFEWMPGDFPRGGTKST